MQLALLVAMLKSLTEGAVQIADLINMIGEGREPTAEQMATAKARTKALSDRIDAIVSSAAAAKPNGGPS